MHVAARFPFAGHDAPLQPLELFPRALVARVPGVERAHGLEEDAVDFLIRRAGHVLHAARNDDELARADSDVAVAQFHDHAALHDVEHLVFGIMMVPGEVALELHELHVLAVQLADDARVPVVLDEAEFVADGHLVHSRTLLTVSRVDGGVIAAAAEEPAPQQRDHEYPVAYPNRG